jgi:hypothetical protein
MSIAYEIAMCNIAPRKMALFSNDRYMKGETVL